MKLLHIVARAPKLVIHHFECEPPPPNITHSPGQVPGLSALSFLRWDIKRAVFSSSLPLKGGPHLATGAGKCLRIGEAEADEVELTLAPLSFVPRRQHGSHVCTDVILIISERRNYKEAADRVLREFYMIFFIFFYHHSLIIDEPNWCSVTILLSLQERGRMWGWQEQRGRQGESCVYTVAQLRSDGNWWTGKIVHSRAKPTLGSKKRNEACQGWNCESPSGLCKSLIQMV